ncbi:MAG: asparagine synthase (glutamine-hydrolyzing) [Rhodospirillales bacterium]|nr:asparagine synthase (glutamine-hydrolyzing) [Rhodospirillales bacterium]
MCGIAGVFDLVGAARFDPAVVRAMAAALAHRGPDGDGFHEEAGVALGHRRLAIVDPAGGQQPMYNEDGSVAIVFNGMIYNFQSLRPRLEALGHVFRTHCDTETIVHAWEAWGPDCLAELEGMFAFAIWDRGRGELFLARDRLGEKPLYYAVLPDGRFAFASEMAGLGVVPGLARTVSARGLADFLAYGYVPDPDTIYSQVSRLPAGHALRLRRGGAVSPYRYWRPSAATVPIGEADAIAELGRRLEAVTTSRLIADVPLGAFLSGGVDSSAVVAMAARARAGIDTFTIGFAGAEDETPYAALVAARYGTTQHVEMAGAVDMIDAARRQGQLFGEPFGDQSAVHTHRVSALARRFAKVAISGDGGDEVFGGYRRYRWHVLVEGARRLLPAGVRRRAIGGLAAIYPKLDRAPRWLRAKHTLTELSLDSALGYYRTLARVQDAARRALLAPGVAAALDGYDPGARIGALMAEAGTGDALGQAQYVDLATWLPGAMLAKVDRTSMANGLEVRAPFLEYRLAEWGLSLPASLKLRGGEGKYVLKRALEPFLPREVLYRPKQGFAMSLDGVFRAKIARLRARLLGPGLGDTGLFRMEAVARLLDEHAAGAFDHSLALWQLLAFEGFAASELADATPAPAMAG